MIVTPCIVSIPSSGWVQGLAVTEHKSGNLEPWIIRLEHSKLCRSLTAIVSYGVDCLCALEIFSR